jgi:hypothetical protein
MTGKAQADLEQKKEKKQGELKGRRFFIRPL